MERRTRRPHGTISALDLIDDGAELSRELSKLRDLNAEDRDRALADLIDSWSRFARRARSAQRPGSRSTIYGAISDALGRIITGVFPVGTCSYSSDTPDRKIVVSGNR